LLTACGLQESPETPTTTTTVQSSTGATNPYPLEGTPSGAVGSENPYPASQDSGTSTYPGPESGNQSPVIASNSENFVSDLDIPVPSSGNAVVIGQLVNAQDNSPLLTTLYLSVAEIKDDPSLPPKVHFSADTDPMAIQDIDTGQFMFSEVAPGKYAIVVLTPSESFFLKDTAGNTLVIDVQADETKDVGVFAIE
jgi:hypothetical protein